MSLDLVFDYKSAKEQLAAIKSYNDLKGSYDEVTKEMVESWLTASLDSEAIEANLDGQIENFISPKIVAYTLPWQDPINL